MIGHHIADEGTPGIAVPGLTQWQPAGPFTNGIKPSG
jgi:hypothetical protein